MIGNNQFYGDINSRYLISDQVNISKMKSKDKLPENSGKVPLTCKIWNRLLLMMNNFFRGDRGNFARINLNDNKMTPYEAHKSEIFQNQNSIPIKGYSTNLFENIQTSDMALSASATAGVLPSPLGEALKTINIIYTNDLHGAIRPVEKKSGDKVGGISHVVTVIKDLKNKADGNALVVDGGDWAQGSLESAVTKGETMVKAMNKAGYDAAVVGNHEFDWTQKDLKDMVKKADFAVL